MKKVANFEKVSYAQFSEAIKDKFGDTYSNADIEKMYTEIKLPKRATVDSAGYDFFTPVPFRLQNGNEITIPTGIRCDIDSGWVLMCYPRSGLGFKYSVRLANTVGVIDGDYYYSDNEGHIFAKVSTGKDIALERGDGFMQGIFTPYGITYDDDEQDKKVRNGGFGSTGK